MKLTQIVESKQQLLEQHRKSGLMLLVESTQGLDVEQRQVVENVYRHFLPLIEASLTKDQIQQIFQQVEKGATDAGGNRTALGKSKDVIAKANDIINQAGKWLQDTKPVQNFDAKFEKLKNDINKKFPDSKILDGISKMGMWAQENPGKTAAIVGILTAVASLAGGPVGGAIAGQVLRGSVELLKGEKLSTAIGKGIKTAALGYLTGALANQVGGWLSGLRAEAVPFKDGLEQVTFSGRSVIKAPGFEWTREFNLRNMVVLPEDADTVTELVNAVNAGEPSAFDRLYALSKEIRTPEYKQAMAEISAAAKEAAVQNDAAFQALEVARKGITAAAQGGVAAAGVAADNKEKKESKVITSKKLSEGQIYMLFNRVDRAQDYLAEAGLLSKVGGAIKGAVSKVGQKIATTGKNLTTKVTADKLNSAWQKAGSPTDSAELFDFLTQQGVNKEVIAPVYDTMKLPVPKGASEPADDTEQSTEPKAAGQKLEPAKDEPAQATGTVRSEQPAAGTNQKPQAQQATGLEKPAQSSGKIDIVALAQEIKSIDPDITGDVKKMLDADLAANKKAAPKQQPKPTAEPQPAAA